MRRLAIGYALVVVAIAGAMSMCRPVAPESKGSAMTWSQVQQVTVPAKPMGVWTWAIDYVKGPARILIEATDGAQWCYSPGCACGPDGDLSALLSAEHTILPTAPVGALILKIGGSTAGTTDGTTRVAGSKAYIEIDDKVSGPVFLTINDALGGMSDNTGELHVKISIAPLPAAPIVAGASAAAQ